MKQMKPTVIVFDVKETLLAMSLLKKKVNKFLDSKKGFRIWFGLLMQYSLVDNCTRVYHDFFTIADTTPDMAAIALGITINAERTQETLSKIKKQTAYPDVDEGLKFLKEAGHRLATPINSPPATQSEELQYAGLTEYFEQPLSIDAVKMYKPANECYQYAANALGLETEDMLMVAAHGWDIAGSMAASMQDAFIERKGHSPYSLSTSHNIPEKIW